MNKDKTQTRNGTKNQPPALAPARSNPHTRAQGKTTQIFCEHRTKNRKESKEENSKEGSQAERGTKERKQRKRSSSRKKSEKMKRSKPAAAAPAALTPEQNTTKTRNKITNIL